MAVIYENIHSLATRCFEETKGINEQKLKPYQTFYKSLKSRFVE